MLFALANAQRLAVASLAHCECSSPLAIIVVYWYHLSTLHAAIACHGGPTTAVFGEEEIKKLRGEGGHSTVKTKQNDLLGGFNDDFYF